MRALRVAGRTAAGVVVGAAATLTVVGEGFYDIGVIGKAAYDNTSNPQEDWMPELRREQTMRWSDAEIARASRQRIARIFEWQLRTFAQSTFSARTCEIAQSPTSSTVHSIRSFTMFGTSLIRKRSRHQRASVGSSTVDDYCNHMIHSYRTNEKVVARTLESDRHTAT
jgi:hypothetical protein